MSVDPSYDLQAAIFSTLTGDAGVIAAMGGTANVFDRVPQNPPFPFLHIGADQVLEGDRFQFSGASDVHVMVDIFSRYQGFAELKRIAGAVRSALSTDLTVNNFRVITWEFISTRYMLDPDGLTNHAVLEMRYELTA